MRYLLTNPEPNIIEFVAKSGDSSEVVWRKDIRDLKYPAPRVEFVGPFDIEEICPDSGRSIKIQIK